jgi:hypothetical protein
VNPNADTVDGYHASGTPTANTLIALDSSAYLPVPRVVDSNSPSYYLDPASTSYLNSLYATYIYANRYYDRNNTNYYADPASTSILSTLDLRGSLYNGPGDYVTVDEGLHVENTATSGTVYSLWGETSSTNGRGVLGYATATTGTSYGVWGWGGAPDSLGVYGYNNSTTGNAVGVKGTTNSNDLGTGVWGVADATTGTTYGVYGENYAGGAASLGWHKATSGSGLGVWGYTSSPDAWAGQFSGVGNGVRIVTLTDKIGLTVTGGSKNAAVPTTEGERLLYTEESTEVWFTDYGFGHLDKGQVVIPIDPLFAQTVNLKVGYHVFLQAYGDAELYVSDRGLTSFEVRLRDGDPNVEFSYRIVAKRLGFETDRLELAPWSSAEADMQTQGLVNPDGQPEPASPSGTGEEQPSGDLVP